MRRILISVFSFVLIIVNLSACESRKLNIESSNQQITKVPTEAPIEIPQKTPTELPNSDITESPTHNPIKESGYLKQIEPIIWYADITHDGIDDKIVVDLTYVINYPETGEEKTVSVYSGSTESLIWTGHADTVHPGYNGIYIYNDGTNEYLLIWLPMIYQDRANFSLQVFSLLEEGKVQELATKTIDFDMSRPNECDTNAISSYIEEVNSYLKNSYVLVDTDNGTPVYSTEKNKIVNVYDASGIFNEIEELKKNN